MKFVSLGILLIVCSGLGGCGQGQTSKAATPAFQSPAPAAATQPASQVYGSSPSSLTNRVQAAAATQPASEIYREVTEADGIKFYSTAQKETYQFDALHEEGYECGVIGPDGKKIQIALVSTTVDRGRVETKDLGVLMIEAPNTLLATESQIRQLRTLQSSGQ